LQEAVVTGLDQRQVLSITPGSLYSALGADRIAPLLHGSNVLFIYEHQLDILLERSAAKGLASAAHLTDKLSVLFAWRATRGPAEPMLVFAHAMNAALAFADSDATMVEN
jgi:hypothetical protein